MGKNHAKSAKSTIFLTPELEEPAFLNSCAVDVSVFLNERNIGEPIAVSRTLHPHSSFFEIDLPMEIDSVSCVHVIRSDLDAAKYLTFSKTACFFSNGCIFQLCQFFNRPCSNKKTDIDTVCKVVIINP